MSIQVIMGIFLVAIGDLAVILETSQPMQAAASGVGSLRFSVQNSNVGFAMIFVGVLLLVAHVFTMPI